MRRILAVLTALILLCGCGGSSGGASTETYNGDTVDVPVSSSGTATVSSPNMGVTYEIAVLNELGQPVSGISVSYSESASRSVIYIRDESGTYADIILIGTPQELSTANPKSARVKYTSQRATAYNLGVTLKRKSGTVTGFVTDAEEVSLYISASERAGANWETGCYTAEGIASYVAAHSAGKESVFGFEGITVNNVQNIKLGTSWANSSNLAAAFTYKLAETYGMSAANAMLANYQLTCFSPKSGTGSIELVCEIVKNNSVCQTAPEVEENKVPVINGTPAYTAAIGSAYSFIPSAADGDGDTLTFSIDNKPSWADFDTATGALTGNVSVGVFSGIVISVTDGKDTVSLPAFTITVNAAEPEPEPEPEVNNVPKISGTPSTALYINQTYDFTPSATDADGDDLNFTIQNKPAWAVFNETTGRLSGTATAGTYTNIVISVSDGKDTASLTVFSITVANRAPVITGTPQTTASLGSAYSFKPAAYDLDGSPLTFSITNRPGWASFDEATGELSGTTTAGIYGSIVISVSDGIDTVALPAFSISIASANHAPTITGTPTASLYVKTAYSFTPDAADADGDTMTFGILNKPDWASFDTSTGTLSGAPTDNILYDGIVIYVSDGKSTTFLESFSITGLNHVPTISGTMPRYRWNMYLPSTSLFAASDEDGDTLTFSLQNQPSGMVINASTGLLSFYGVTIGTFENIMVTVSDGRTGGVATIGPFTVDVLNWAYTKTGAAASYLDFDDKYYNQGFEPNYTRDASTGIVTDNLSGMMWQDDAAVVFSFSNAQNYCSNLVLGGYDDWYLPDMWSFNTLADYGRSPAFNSVFQNFDTAATYWTMSQYGSYWVVFSGNGKISSVNTFVNPDLENTVKCCRYPQSFYTPPTFKRDHNTRIVDAKGSLLQWDDDTSSAQVATLSDAVNYCENKTLNGLTDWRLPNIKEMISLVKDSFELNGEFLNVASAPYWTSTTDSQDNSKAWYLNISGGLSDTTAKTDTLHIRCVRGGISE